MCGSGKATPSGRDRETGMLLRKLVCHCKMVKMSIQRAALGVIPENEGTLSYCFRVISWTAPKDSHQDACLYMAAALVSPPCVERLALPRDMASISHFLLVPSSIVACCRKRLPASKAFLTMASQHLYTLYILCSFHLLLVRRKLATHYC